MEVGRDSREDTKGFLECPVCSNYFELPPRNAEGGLDRETDLSFSHIPKILSGCLHTVCQSCAEEAFQRSGSPTVLPCPICSVSTTGVPTTSSLTENVMALQDVKRWSSNCDLCAEVVRASHRCVDCQSVICAFHVKHHTRSRATKAHSIMPLKLHGVAKIPASTSSTSKAHHVPIFCPRHDGVPAKLFCSEPCGRLICYDCSVANHTGHAVFLADSPEVEVTHRTRLTRYMVNLRHRLATVQGAVQAVESVRMGIEQSTRAAERAALQAFANLRQAVDSRETTMLENLRGARVSKTQDLVDQLRVLNEALQKYSTALETTDQCLDSLQGDQLMAMEPDLRVCLENHEAGFASLPMEPCVDDRVEFAYDKRIASAVNAGISKLGCVASAATDFIHDSNSKNHNNDEHKIKPAKESSSSSSSSSSRPSNKQNTPRNPKYMNDDSSLPQVHFTLAANVGGAAFHQNKPVGFSTPKSDTVVVEMRHGSEEAFLRTGVEGPILGRVVLETRLEGAKYLKYEAEHLFESLSPRVLSDAGSKVSHSRGHHTPAVRFTKRLRVAGRRGVDWRA